MWHQRKGNNISVNCAAIPSELPDRAIWARKRRLHGGRSCKSKGLNKQMERFFRRDRRHALAIAIEIIEGIGGS